MLFEKRNWYELHGKSLSWELEQEFEKFYREQELGWKDYKKEKRCELILAQSSISPPLKRPNLELKSKKDLLSVQLSFKGMVARTVCKEIIKSFKVETGKIEEKVINEEERNLTSSDILSMGGVFRFAGVYFIPFSNKYIPSGDFVVRNFQILDSDENLFKVDIPPLNKGELLIGVIIMDNFQTIFPQLFSKDFFISSMVSPPTIEISEISFKEFFNNPQFPGVVTLSCLRDRYNIPLETLNIYGINVGQIPY